MSLWLANQLEVSHDYAINESPKVRKSCPNDVLTRTKMQTRHHRPHPAIHSRQKKSLNAHKQSNSKAGKEQKESNLLFRFWPTQRTPLG
jgi:hypothetical protein